MSLPNNINHQFQLSSWLDILDFEKDDLKMVLPKIKELVHVRNDLSHRAYRVNH